MLYDFYAPLLTEKQREAIRLYHCENLSLAEIGEEFSISRQGVYDALKNAEKTLAVYEEKLGLLSKLIYTSNIAKDACEKIDALVIKNEGDESLTKELLSIKELITRLDG